MPKTIVPTRCGAATLAALASLALVAAPIQTARGDQPSTPVTVDNTATNPVPSIVVNPADIAKALGIQHPVTFPLTSNLSIGGDSTFTVPSNQRLIIEYASGSCSVASGTLNTLSVGVLAPNFVTNFQFPVNFSPLSTSSTSGVAGNFAHTVKIYADPGSLISLGSTFIAGTGTQISCAATFSGQLVDVP